MSAVTPVTIADDLLLQRDAQLLATDMDGELVMMSLARGEYFGIGGIGPRLWELLARPISPAGLRAAVLAEFDVDAATCQRDTDEFIAALLDKGLIRPCTA